MSKSAMTQLRKIWKDSNIRRQTKVSLVRTLIFSIFLYGSETWTIKAVDMDRINAFEMWCWRRMLQIPWTAFRTNESILKLLHVKERLSTIVLKRYLRYFGHIARKPPDNIEKSILLGKRQGKRPRGRRPTRWTDLLSKTLQKPFQEAYRLAQDRERWRQLIVGVGDGVTILNE
ncbi:hypothetical protein B5X24_HaOG209168 [Helicoverpa armigera]|nr:hypothetical protein B5X24_HaOG209168 [Helicoverpa armigera]